MVYISIFRLDALVLIINGIDDEGSVVKVDIEEENGERKQENERRIPCNFMNGTI